MASAGVPQSTQLYIIVVQVDSCSPFVINLYNSCNGSTPLSLGKISNNIQINTCPSPTPLLTLFSPGLRPPSSPHILIHSFSATYCTHTFGQD